MKNNKSIHKKYTKKTYNKLWNDLHYYNNKMKTGVNKKTKNRKGGNLSNLAEVAKNLVIPGGFLFMKQYLKKHNKSQKKKKHKGGFIRSGSTQHFYAPCKTNKIILDKNNNSFNQEMNNINSNRIGKQPNIYSVNSRDINVASDSNRSRGH